MGLLHFSVSEGDTHVIEIGTTPLAAANKDVQIGLSGEPGRDRDSGRGQSLAGVKKQHAMQRDFTSLAEAPPLSDRLRAAGEQIDPAAYREVAMALVAVDAPVSAAARLAYAIALSRGQECQRHFIGEYAQLLWESLQDAIGERSQP